MSGTYKATGINLKSMPLGESDRLVTILTREYGLIRAVAPGARKHHSKLSGRSGLFVVNELLIAKGRSLDKITQAETVESYPRLSQDLKKLSASQYLAELVLCQALSEQPQEELYCLLREHLSRLEQCQSANGDPALASPVLAHLAHGVFHLLALAGIAPQVQLCCITQQPLKPDWQNLEWQVGFSIDAGGTVSLEALRSLEIQARQVRTPVLRSLPTQSHKSLEEEKEIATVEINGNENIDFHPQMPPRLSTKLGAVELTLLQQMAGAELPALGSVELGAMSDRINISFAQNTDGSMASTKLKSARSELCSAWVSVEQILRQYVQYHFGRSIRSAALMDACF